GDDFAGNHAVWPGRLMVVIVSFTVVVIVSMIVVMVMVVRMVVIVRIVMRMVVIVFPLCGPRRRAGGSRKFGQKRRPVLFKSQFCSPVHIAQRHCILASQFCAKLEFGREDDAGAEASQLAGHRSPRSRDRARSPHTFVSFDHLTTNAERRRFREENGL